MSQCIFTVTVNPADVNYLKTAGYKLCIAKKVNNAYNVIWRGGNFFYKNVFTWTSKYQVFGTNTYAEDIPVVVSTETQSIQYGQTALLDDKGNMQPPTGMPDETGTFHVNNDYGGLRIGVRAETDPGQFATIFVSPTLVSGNVDLTPIESVLVWFDTKRTTNTMILTSATNALEVDFTGKLKTRGATFASDPEHPGHGAWTLDSQLMLSSTYDAVSNTFTVQKPSSALLIKMSQVLTNASKVASMTVDGIVTVTALAEFASGVDAGAFTEYIKKDETAIIYGWEINQPTESTVRVVMVQVDGHLERNEVVRLYQDALLSIYYKYKGPGYDRLSIDVTEGIPA